MTYQTSYDLANDIGFRERIEQAIIKAAIDIQAEDEIGLSLPAGFTGLVQALHKLRAELAYDVLHQPHVYAIVFAKAVANDPNNAGINVNSIDADLLFTVNSIWNAFSIRGDGS